MAGQCRSLKEKRAVVRKLKDRVRSSHRIVISEVGGQDTWQRIVIGFAVVGGDRGTVRRVVDEIVRFVAGSREAELVADEREILTCGDEFFGDRVSGRPGGDGGGGDGDDWIPEEWKADAREPGGGGSGGKKETA